MITLKELKNIVNQHHNSVLDILLNDYIRACLRYLSARSEHIYRKYSGRPTEFISEADQNRTRAHDNLIACYHSLIRNLNKNLDPLLPVCTSRIEIGLLGIDHAIQLLKDSA